MKKIIFYQPINDFNKDNINSGTLIRPKKMRGAFSKIGYEVININGSFENRNLMVENALKQDIEFAYFESNNTPMFLTCKNIGKIDFISDLRNIKKIKQKTKIGFYYRDNFWTESSYFKKVGFIKGILLRICFFIEYLLLIKLVDYLFVQSEEMIESFPFSNKYRNKFKLLPPACEDYDIDLYEYNPRKLNILYSGACDDYSKYNIFPLLSKIKNSNIVNFYINSNFVEELFNRYPEYNNIDNIYKMSVSYENIDKLPNSYSVGIVYLNGKNRDIKKYLPIKVFYYLSLGLPILAQDNTATGKFIKVNNIGWVYKDLNDINSIVNNVINNPTELNEKHNNVIEFRKNQHWINRAQEVKNILS